ncbi:MAG: PIN domain-containing protein, partial [Calditrichia bacterium]
MIYIDTGAFLARYIKRDQYHKQAVEFWNQLRKMRERCFTSNFVLDETFTLLGRRAGYKFAIQRARNMYLSKKLTILRATHEDELMALDIWDKYADQELSFTDCISFTCMGKNKIKRVFSFDSHFNL